MQLVPTMKTAYTSTFKLQLNDTEPGVSEEDVIMSMMIASECRLVINGKVDGYYVITYITVETEELAEAVRKTANFLYEIQALCNSISLPKRAQVWIFLDEESFEQVPIIEWVSEKVSAIASTEEFFIEVK